MANLKRIPWWQWWPWKSWRVVTVVEAADDVPGRLPRNGAVFVGSKSIPKWLVFDCPCRTGHRVLLNLESRRWPSWHVVDERKLTVLPSVDAHGPNRQCHYFIKQGRIHWVPEAD